MTPPRERNSRPPQDWSDSDRAALDAFRAEREFEAELSRRRQTMRDSIKNAAQLITAVALVFSLGKDAVIYVWNAASKLLNGGP